MNMPGFNAEGSLDPTAGSYGGRPLYSRSASRSMVAPMGGGMPVPPSGVGPDGLLYWTYQDVIDYLNRPETPAPRPLSWGGTTTIGGLTVETSAAGNGLTAAAALALAAAWTLAALDIRTAYRNWQRPAARTEKFTIEVASDYWSQHGFIGGITNAWSALTN